MILSKKKSIGRDSAGSKEATGVKTQPANHSLLSLHYAGVGGEWKPKKRKELFHCVMVMQNVAAKQPKYRQPLGQQRVEVRSGTLAMEQNNAALECSIRRLWWEHS